LIYICIPAFNEADTVGVLLWKIRRVMSDFGRDYQLLVLDDASEDHTREVLGPYGSVLPLTVLRNREQKGYAAAVERLIRESVERSTHPRRDVAVLLQGDFTENPEQIPDLVKRIEGGADLVGTRWTEETEVPRLQRWSRRGLPWILPRAALPEEIGDPLTGFRAYRISALRRALRACNGAPMLEGDGWAVNVELLLHVLPHARRTSETEVSARYGLRRRASRFQPLQEMKRVWAIRRHARERASTEETSE